MNSPTVALVEFGLGGHGEEYMPTKECGSMCHSRLSGYSNPDNWKPSDNSIYPDGTPVLDIRDVVREQPSLAIKAPMCQPGIKEREPFQNTLKDGDKEFSLAPCMGFGMVGALMVAEASFGISSRANI